MVAVYQYYWRSILLAQNVTINIVTGTTVGVHVVLCKRVYAYSMYCMCVCVVSV